MGAAARALGRPDATARFADLVESRMTTRAGWCAMAADRELDLTQPHAIHVVGVGGAGMSAIATVLARMGHTVSGSDLRESAALERLGLLDVTTHIGHAAEHLPDALDAVVISTAIPESNPEVVGRARARHPGAAARRRAARHRGHPHARSRWPGATARRPRRRCSR